MNPVKKSIVGFSCSIPFLFFSCTKNSDATPPVPDGNEQQIFISQTINKHVFNTITLDTFRYQYNPQGQLIHRYRTLTGEKTDFIYSGDTVKAINMYDNNGNISTYSNFMTISNNGNTILIDESPTLMDTVHYYYYFKGNVIQSYKMYVHYSGNAPREMVYTYRYDGNENLREFEISSNVEAKRIYTVQSVGGKNPFYKMIKTNFIYQGGAAVFLLGKMTPVTYNTPEGTVEEYEYTYNSNGFPTSFSSKDSEDITFYEYYP